MEKSAENFTINLEGNSNEDEDVWGMPKYEQNYESELENLTDEQYLARVSLKFIKFQGVGDRNISPLTVVANSVC